MKVLIIGLGAIGSLLAYMFSKDERVRKLGVVVRKPEDATFLRTDGVTLKFSPPPKDLPPKYRRGKMTIDPSTRYIIPDDVFFSVQQALAEVEDWEVIVLALKAYDLKPVAWDIAKFFKPRKSYTLLLVQNGWGLEEELLDRFSPDKLMIASITIPVESLDRYKYKVYDYPSRGIAISPLSKDNKLVRDVISVLRKAGTKLAFTLNWKGVKLSKLLLNLIGNATSAITGLTPSELFGDERVVRLERESVLELLRATKRANIDLEFLPGYPVPLIAAAFKALPLKLLAVILRSTAAKGRGNKLPSLLHDLRRGKRESEVDWLNGGVVRLARAVNTDAPHNAILTELVKEVYSTGRHLTVDEMLERFKAL